MWQRMLQVLRSTDIDDCVMFRHPYGGLLPIYRDLMERTFLSSISFKTQQQQEVYFISLRLTLHPITAISRISITNTPSQPDSQYDLISISHTVTLQRRLSLLPWTLFPLPSLLFIKQNSQNGSRRLQLKRAQSASSRNLSLLSQPQQNSFKRQTTDYNHHYYYHNIHYVSLQQ